MTADSPAQQRHAERALGSRGAVNLMTHDLGESQRFYGAVMGWTFRGNALGHEFCVAQDAEGGTVAVFGAVASTYQVAVAWIPFFAVAAIDDTVARVRERSGTVAIGPLRLPRGRGALAADRDGAVFGVWQDDGTPGHIGRRSRLAWVELRTRDSFEAAIFYGEVLGWGTEAPGAPEVRYEEEAVVVRDGDNHLARISSGAVEAAPDPLVRPMWRVHFPVADLDAAVAAAARHSGALVERRDGPDFARAVLRDPAGAIFTLAQRTGG
ncbi:VOC family protein [Streptomyces sp. NRRL F-5630]|uniref:VOC family protein n=1 Tax=Streptomyces sp. NRRL F-5630 TaxID=1463864 RepID=UPI003EBAE11D